MRKILIMLSLMFLILNLTLFNYSSQQIFAYDSVVEVEPYKVYDDNYYLLFERDEIEVGDNYLSKDYNFYEIVYIDTNTKTALAKFIRKVERPNVEKSFGITPINTQDRVICMYMTHNDESYVPTDGVDSVYGNGGIKDVALAFKKELEKKLINVYFDDTLHIPHDTSAYSRSEVTAKNLNSTYSPDAIFDIHRDGASRKFYVSNVDGKERGRVRMVIGKSNPNMNLNEEFATYLMAVGNEMYPWLFTDIYYGKGHYNQSIDSKAILFEMGSHLVEKELEIESMKELADVVSTALYKTTVNTDNGDLTVNGIVNENNIIINDALDKKENKKTEMLAITIVIVITAGLCIYVFFVLFNHLSKKS